MENQVPPHPGSLADTAVPSRLLGRCLQGGASGLRRGLQSIRAGAQAAICASKGVAANVGVLPAGLNSGMMLIRNSPWSKEFFRAVGDLGRLDDHQTGGDSLKKVGWSRARS